VRAVRKDRLTLRQLHFFAGPENLVAHPVRHVGELVAIETYNARLGHIEVCIVVRGDRIAQDRAFQLRPTLYASRDYRIRIEAARDQLCTG